MLVTRQSFDRALACFTDQPRLVVDTETTGLKPWQGDRVCGVSMALPDLSRVGYFPIRHQPGGNLTWRQYQLLISLLSQPDVVYTGWNYKFDLEFLMQDGMRFPRKIEDVMLACHHLNENDRPFELKRWAVKYADADAGLSEQTMLDLIVQRMKEQKIPGGRKAAKGYIYLLHPAEAEPYACDDVRSTEKLRRVALPELKVWNTRHLWRESNHYALVVAKMERRGFQLDVPRMKTLIKEAKREETKAYAILTERAGFDINVNSPPQMHAFLKVSSATKEILEEMDTPESNAVMDYRAWYKARTTYYEPWMAAMDADQVLHPNLNLHRVVTGRQSASAPGLHQVPRYRREYKVKDAIIARPGFVLLSADYNQAELRMGVSVAKEENMAKLFRKARVVDIHQEVANELQIDRDAAKTINFMILYGGGAAKLARKLKIPFDPHNPRDLATSYLRRYHIEYWHFRHTSNFWQNRARYQGYIRLWSGRVRHFNHPLANPKDAFNSKVQGGVAEMLRIALSKLNRLLRFFDVYALLQIHDQGIWEVPIDAVREVAPIIKHTMEDFDFLIPPIVDLKVGYRWSELKDYAPQRRAA